MHSSAKRNIIKLQTEIIFCWRLVFVHFYQGISGTDGVQGPKGNLVSNLVTFVNPLCNPNNCLNIPMVAMLSVKIELVLGLAILAWWHKFYGGRECDCDLYLLLTGSSWRNRAPRSTGKSRGAGTASIQKACPVAMGLNPLIINPDFLGCTQYLLVTTLT